MEGNLATEALSSQKEPEIHPRIRHGSDRELTKKVVLWYSEASARETVGSPIERRSSRVPQDDIPLGGV
jgi:hypothetical protein